MIKYDDQAGVYEVWTDSEGTGWIGAFDTHSEARDAVVWYSVETPAVFREYALPLVGWMTKQQQRQYAELVDLADIHRTTVQCSPYRRG